MATSIISYYNNTRGMIMKMARSAILAMAATMAIGAAMPLAAEKDHHKEHHRAKRPTLNQQLIHDLMEGEMTLIR